MSVSPAKAETGRIVSRPTRVDSHLLVLPENALAFTAVETLTKTPHSKNAQIVFIYGPSGVGKTQLAQHFLQRVRSADRRPTVMFKHAAEFIDEFIEAAQANNIPQFQRSFAAINCLVIEDFQAFEGSPESQQQLVAQVDRIIGRGGQILFTSRKSPSELKNSNEKLINRCIGGVCAAIQLPGLSSRKELLAHFASVEMIPLPDAAADLLAAELSVSPRELRAAIIQVEAAARLGGCRIDTPFVRNYLQHEAKRPDLGLSDITRAVARQFDISVSRLRSRSRNQESALARQCAMYLSRELTEKRLEEIGRYFGNRDHATVVYACRRIKSRALESAEIRRHITQILQTLNTSTGPDC